MKKNITRIYDKNKVDSRKKYMLIILLILVLQVAVYLGAFSKAEAVIPIEYINYYSQETFDSSIQVKSDIKGEYIVLPEAINNRAVITYYIEEVIESTATNTVDGETVKETTETKEYKPEDKYYIGDSETLSIKVEYGEYLTTQASKDDNTTQNTIASNTIGTQENTLIVDNTIQTGTTTDNNGETEENKIIDTVYLGDIRTRRRTWLSS